MKFENIKLSISDFLALKVRCAFNLRRAFNFLAADLYKSLTSGSKFSLLSIFIPSSLAQFEEIILLLLMLRLIFDVTSSFFLDRNNT